MKCSITRFFLLVTVQLLLSLPEAGSVFGQSPATLSGIIFNSFSGAPVIGAKISVNNLVTYSVFGGFYNLTGIPAGTYPVNGVKPGYITYSSTPVTFISGGTNSLNIPLVENPNPPPSVSAVRDTVIPSVHVSWPVPTGAYEIISDDGIQDDFTVWATQGNMNAVKFTPPGYPARITGGKINIGRSSDYLPGSNPLVLFQVYIYNASGSGGTPGTILSGPVDVIPSALGWVEFNFPLPAVLNSGSCFLVMVQGGNSPNAAGLAIDKTSPQLKSFSRFGSGPWIPADGNFMMRAVADGPGGPLELTDYPGTILGYQIWRLKQGEEQNPAIWTSVGLSSSTTLTDFSWPSLPCSPYRWAVKAQYAGNQWSQAVFSNVIGKCWTVPVTIHAELSCTAGNVAGTNVQLKNLVYPDTVYAAILDTSGLVRFADVWKGTYELKVTRFGYQAFTQNSSISDDTTFSITLLQEKPPPWNLVINDKTLKTSWRPPVFERLIFTENWDSASFFTNGWTVTGGTNWTISSVVGNPVPSAMFGYSPQKTNYEQSLVSGFIEGQHSTILELKYDISLDNYGTTTINQMAVELWDGTTWGLLKNYDNTGGDFSWISETIDISAYTDTGFRIRFRAYGGDTYDINGWYIDNIRILASESSSNLGQCILGYHFYLDNVLLGFTTDTTYTIQGHEVLYGNDYTACVQALFGSGSSSKACTPFTSRYLIPPSNLIGAGIENSAFLSWYKPEMIIDNNGVPPPGLMGYKIYKNGVLRDSVMNPDTLNYYDFGLNPATYSYSVSAKYDLTSYGFPGQYDESFQQGPVSVIINYGRLLPFLEQWEQATFSFNEWTLEPDPGNWYVNTAAGNPAPGAEFSWEPPSFAYSYSLVSPVMNGTAVTCANIWIDYDYRLQNRNATGNELLRTELFYDETWHTINEIANNQSYPWQTEHKNINPVLGKAFRIRFTALGNSTEDILNWNVDNINIYAISYPAKNLAADALGLAVLLTWDPPDCIFGNPLNEGFEGDQFPPQGWTLAETNASDTWFHSDILSPMGVHSGNYAAALSTSYTHQDETLTAHNIAITGSLVFWSYAFQGSVHNDHYYVKVSPDQGLTWQIMLDMSALPPYPGPAGFNQWNEPYVIDMTSFTGQMVDIAWQAIDGDGQGLWYPWSIDDCTVGSDKFSPGSSPRFLSGYDVYRQDADTGDYRKINAIMVTDTIYTDPGLVPGQYRYFVNAIFDQCSPTSSDTVLVDVITSVPEKSGDIIRVYPNPATEWLSVKNATEAIYRVIILDYSGREVLNSGEIETKSFRTSITHLKTGIFLVRIYMQNKTAVKKVIILK